MSVLNTGISALLATQRSFSIASHNIANVNTEGYTRQRVDLTTQEPQPLGSGFIGSGVKIAAIQRVYDQFAVGQIRTSTSAAAQADRYRALAEQVNGLLAGVDSGLMKSMQNFFDSVQGVANDPASQPARQVMISQAENLAAQFQQMDAQLRTLRNDTGSMLEAEVTEINGLARAIADVNRRIMEAGRDSSPNDLLDRRDEMIRQLSEHVSVSTVAQDDGSVSVFIGSGQSLVAGIEARTLTTVAALDDPSRPEIAIANGNSPVVITSQLSGGRVGGILEFRTQILEPTQGALNQLAFGLAATFNEQHALGMDMTGALGGDFFVAPEGAGPPPTTAVIAHGRNTGSPAAALRVEVVDAGALGASDYRLERSGSGYTLTRLDDGARYALAGFPAGAVQVDGLSIALDAGVIADGDSFLISPARNAARNFAVAISDPVRIAAAAPARAGAALENTGGATIAQPELVDPDAWGGGGYRIVALDTDTDGAADSYEVLDADDNVIAGGAFVDGEAIAFAGLRTTISGVPHPGDVFSVGPNTGGVSDNRNALALAGLQNARILGGGAASYQSLYTATVGAVGSKTQQAQVNAQVQEAGLGRAVAARESVSGVNLEEEAAAILRLQQAYQAAAQLIATSSMMFDSLIAVVRR